MPLSSIILLGFVFLVMPLTQKLLTNRSFDEGVKNAFSKNQEAIEFHKKELIKTIAALYQNN